MTSYKLSYFPARNQAEAIRLALHYANVPFEDFRIPFDQWSTKYKPTMPYGTVPVLQIGDKQLGETTTILRYVGRHYGLGGESACQEAKVDELLQVHASEYAQIRDWLLAKTKLQPGNENELYKTALRPVTEKYFKIYVQRLQQNGTGYLVGKRPSVADFYLADYLLTLDNLAPEVIPGELRRYYKNILNLPQVRSYVEKKHVAAIQGLRGVAIFAVLLFHIREDYFEMGYLGVDVFFVISGYLMCMLLSRQTPLDRKKIVDFYYRRIKRIVPVYLAVILATLLAAIVVFMYPLDYKALYGETIRPLAYAANIPSADSLGGYHFFRHLWSLSAEIQFYCFVPILFLILGLFRQSARVVIVVGIAVFSFLKQWTSTGNDEHMSMSSRVWQFMFGFLAHYAKESGCLNSNYWFGSANYEENDDDIFGDSRPFRKFAKIADQMASNALTALLIIFMINQLIPERQLNRLALICVTACVIAKPDGNVILTQQSLVWIGDQSYSIYMVHWPLFEWHRYYDIPMYAHGRHATITVAALLIVASVVVGYLVEKAYAHVSFYINGFRSLAITVIGLYAMIFISMHYLKTNASNEQLVLSRIPFPLRDPQHTHAEMMTVWHTRDSPNPIRTSTSLAFNKNFQQLNWDLYRCRDQRRTSIPTYYDLKNRIGFGSMLNKKGITASCVDQGKGTKNIVVVGNSHAQAYYYGIEHFFNGVYKTMTLLSAGGCFFVRLEERQADLTADKYAACKKFRDDLITILAAWHHPIDVIIVAHGYLYPTDPPISVLQITDDPHFIELQTLYSRLSSLAREVVLVPQVQFETGITAHMTVLQRRILYGEDVMDMFRINYELEAHVRKNLKKRIAQVNCSKCVLVDFEEVFCRKDEGICESVEPTRKLSYFFDINHVNAYGSLHVGQYMRSVYDKWIVDHPTPVREKTSGNQRRNLLKKLQRVDT
ncbi:hypothetical protein M3Y96_00262100 [Aphelenchoides besseyi]|nr:hypothetical protein M3Y96_00262100 [Aphelenchoides besseyi]